MIMFEYCGKVNHKEIYDRSITCMQYDISWYPACRRPIVVKFYIWYRRWWCEVYTSIAAPVYSDAVFSRLVSLYCKYCVTCSAVLFVVTVCVQCVRYLAEYIPTLMLACWVISTMQQANCRRRRCIQHCTYCWYYILPLSACLHALQRLHLSACLVQRVRTVSRVNVFTESHAWNSQPCRDCLLTCSCMVPALRSLKVLGSWMSRNVLTN